jgi:predicted phosphate transport protein (TIGR00153 family)
MFRLEKSKDPFFGAFTAHAALSVRAAGLLRQLFERPAEAESLKEQISQAEHEGDVITRATITRLRSQWITPLDRPDIHTLTTRLDDVLDTIESIAQRMVLFEIRECSGVAMDIARLLETSVTTMAKAIELLPEGRDRAQEILAFCTEIDGQESKADALYRTAIAGLFKAGGDPLLVMKWREIYEELEAAADLCDDVANAIQGVVLEY